MKDQEWHPIDRRSDSEGQDPTSACGMEQAHKWLRTSSLPRGCENLRAERATDETVAVTSSHDGAEREQTWGDAGRAAGVGVREKP